MDEFRVVLPQRGKAAILRMSRVARIGQPFFCRCEFEKEDFSLEILMSIPQELRATLPGRMAAINVSLTNLSELLEISVPKLSNFLAGRRDLPIEDITLARNLISDLECLADICSPIPIDFDNTTAIRNLLSRIEAGDCDFTPTEIKAIRIENSEAKEFKGNKCS